MEPKDEAIIKFKPLCEDEPRVGKVRRFGDDWLVEVEGAVYTSLGIEWWADESVS